VTSVVKKFFLLYAFLRVFAPLCEVFFIMPQSTLLKGRGEERDWEAR